MISKEAVKQYLERNLNDYLWIKGCTKEELDEAISSLEKKIQLKHELFKHQKASVYIGACESNFLYFLDMGGGKAQPLDALVLTPTGYKEMKNIQIGDTISHPYKGTSKVIGVFPQGEKDIYKITFADNTFTECCEDHLWIVNSANYIRSNKPWQIKPLKELKDNLIYNGILPNRKWFIPITNRLEFTSEKELKIDSYLLGLLLGDGCLVRGVGFTTADEEILKELEILLPEGSVIKQKNSIDYSVIAKNYKSPYNHSNELLKELRALDLIGTKSRTKFIPNEYLYSSFENRLKLFQGLIDTDGYISVGGGLRFDSTSENLAKGIQFLAQSFGGIGRLTISKNEFGLKYSVGINLPPDIQPCKLTRKLNRYTEGRHFKYQPARAIKSIEYIGKKEAQCIKINHNDGLYLTNDFIVTHNTIISLWLIEFYKRLKKIERALVVVPNVINVQGWEEEVRYHTNLTTTLLYGSKNERELLLESNSDIFVINYDGLQTLMADFAPSTRKKGKKERVINKTKAYNFADLFDFVVFDEIHKTKNHNSLTYKLCDIIASSCKYRYGLTGTPFGRNPHDLWTQFYLVDRGETLGTTLGIFRSAFFTQKRNHWGGFDYKFDKSKEDLLNKILQNKSIRYEDKEFSDLPPTVHTVVPLRLAPDAVEYYRETVKESMNAAIEGRDRDNYYVKWREICSGFVYIKDPETKEKHELTFSHTEKLDALEEILDDIPKDSRLIIFHIYNKSGQIICDFLTKKKVKFVAINSTSEDDAVTSYKKYQTDSKVKILVANIASGSTGLNLQSANYVVFWEPTDRPIWQKQAEKRVHRHGQTKRVYYYHFITKFTVEEKIREFVIEGKNLFDALITGKISTKEASGLQTK